MSARKLAEQWKRRADDCGQLSRAVLRELLQSETAHSPSAHTAARERVGSVLTELRRKLDEHAEIDWIALAHVLVDEHRLTRLDDVTG